MENLRNGYLMRYLDDTIMLAKTLVFKLSDVASLMNEGIALKYGEAMVDLNDPTSWKYYMNIAGQYHPTDSLMRVVSIDTLDEIDFTVQNLTIHSATAEAYRYGTRQYYMLLKRYPSQELLINGILNPADIDLAIAAEEGKIISYRKDLVEVNEHSLITELEVFIRGQIERWYNQQFNLSNELYCAVFLALLQASLVQKLLNLRLKRCHTYEAHSFHVRMFLASHNELDRYIPYLTLSQQLWLYRNIRYIERHSGILFQFYRLIEKLLTERGIPIGEYEVRQQDAFNNYIPEVIAKSNPLNGEYNRLLDNTLEVSALFDKEISQAPGNELYLKYSLDSQLAHFNHGESAIVQTKVLHSSMVDLTNAVPETFEEIALRQWCQMSNNGLYDAYVTFRDPKTSLSYSLHAKDAFVYMTYIAMEMDGYPLIEIPEYLNMRQRRNPRPTVDDLLKVVDYKARNLQHIAEAVVARQPVISQCLSVESFRQLIDTLYGEAYWHWFVVSNTEDYYERGLVENMISQLYEDERVMFNTPTRSVGLWLEANNLPTYDYSRTEAMLLVKAIFEAGAGLKLNSTKTLKGVQKALIELMKELSSYTIQFVREINDSDLIQIDWPAIRFGNQRMQQDYYVPIESGVLVMDAPSQVTSTAYVGTEVDNRLTEQAWLKTAPLIVALDPVLDEEIHVTTQHQVTDLDGMFTMDVTYVGQDEAIDNRYGIPGISIYQNLPLALKKTVKSIYPGV